MSKSSFGPFIIIGFLILVIMVAVVFGSTIFANIEAETDFTNMTAAQNQSYDTTSQIAQVGLSGFEIVGFLLILAVIVFATGFLYRMAFK